MSVGLTDAGAGDSWRSVGERLTAVLDQRMSRVSPWLSPVPWMGLEIVFSTRTPTAPETGLA